MELAMLFVMVAMLVLLALLFMRLKSPGTQDTQQGTLLIQQQIDALREWAKARTIPANRPQAEEAIGKRRVQL